MALKIMKNEISTANFIMGAVFSFLDQKVIIRQNFLLPKF